MTRLLRILLNAATVLSQLVGGAAAILWVRSHAQADRLALSWWSEFEQEVEFGDHCEISTAPGLLLIRHTCWMPLRRATGNEAKFEWQWGDVRDVLANAHWVRRNCPIVPNDPEQRWASLPFWRRGYDHAFAQGCGFAVRHVALRFWFILLVSAILPLVRVGLRTLRRGGRRSGCCPVCGYDLRATPQRCPECGTAVAGGRSAMAGRRS